MMKHIHHPQKRNRNFLQDALKHCNIWMTNKVSMVHKSK